MKNTIKVNITKVARRKCGIFQDPCHCLLATAITRSKKEFAAVDVGYDQVELDGVKFKFPLRIARKIHHAYYKPKSQFKPFTVTLRRVPPTPRYFAP